MHFGPSSEKLTRDIAQLELQLEDLEANQAEANQAETNHAESISRSPSR